MIATLEPQISPASCAGAAAAHYLLVCHARNLNLTAGVWYFSLETLAGEPLLEAEDQEEGDLNRLSLLAAVRGLEAIDGSGRVTLVSNNRYLIRSLDQSLPRWRDNDFVWENFGRKMAVQNADLWRRIDQALRIHEVTASLVQTTRVSRHGPASAVTGQPGSTSTMLAVSDSDPAMPTLRVDRPHRVPAAPPTDRLRRWLAGDGEPAPRPGRRGRYRPEDWADAS